MNFIHGERRRPAYDLLSECDAHRTIYRPRDHRTNRRPLGEVDVHVRNQLVVAIERLDQIARDREG